MPLPILAVVVSGSLAILSAERGIAWLQVVSKPLTTALLLWVVGWPATRIADWAYVGIVLSVVGDIALLRTSKVAFLVGLGAFLLAHLAYIVAFFGVAVWSPRLVVVALVMAVVTARLLQAIRAKTAEIRGPTVAYGIVISAMVVAAWATVGGPLPGAWMAAAGAVLFYASDASLALNQFGPKKIPHAAFLTLGLYWIGQLGIALSARGGGL
ncbi:MAG TPA: lysoplasmalogenase [Polyangia bacterium]|nr:lysoplasmalogenase [Polyangia bacterium]